MRKQHLVPFDPFTRVPNYSGIRDAVRIAVDGDMNLISGIISKDIAPIHKAAFLYALFQEVETLYTAKLPPASVYASVSMLRKWIGSSSFFSIQFLPFFSLFYYYVTDDRFGPKESPILRGFTLPVISPDPAAPRPQIPADGKPTHETFLTFDNSMTPARMLQLGCVTRAVGLALASQGNASMKFLFDALVNPARLSKVFLPTMASDARLALMEIMGSFILLFSLAEEITNKKKIPTKRWRMV